MNSHATYYDMISIHKKPKGNLISLDIHVDEFSYEIMKWALFLLLVLFEISGIYSDYNACSLYYWKVDWESANRTCEADNKKLLCYSSKQEIDDIAEAYRLSDYGDAELEFWLSHRNCSRPDEHEKCLSLHIQKSGSSVWHFFQTDCRNRLPFVCCTKEACPEIVPRAAWGARSAKSTAMKVPVTHVFIHHTAGATCNSKDTCSKLVRQVQNYHMDTNKWADIGYSFLVGGDGRIYEGRGWKAVGAHTYNFNSKAIGIAFMGNFDEKEPGSAMLNAARSLIDCGVQKRFITANHEIHGHRDAKCTTCPGTALYKIIQKWPGFKGGKLPGYVEF
nr:peptidoglycan recognition protein 3 isoform X1 [Parasteatoda tepidariorum]